MTRLQPSSLTLGNKILRGAWNLTWIVLYRPSPRVMHGWRRFLLRIFGARLGVGVRPYPSSRVWAPWNLEMGDHACLGDGVDCYSVDKISIGRYATVSQYSFLCTASRDYSSIEMPLVVGRILIGERAWVAADVFVAPGVTIGEGSVVTARSSVFSDVSPWVVARGNPARAVKSRELATAPGLGRITEQPAGLSSATQGI
jgi:putative colanic acid biosynthesis acetyltransferase WcaF